MPSDERFAPGWQEGSFARVQEFVQTTPAFCLDIAPSDVVEDSYLLSLAATAFFVQDTVPEMPPREAASTPRVVVVGPVGVAAFQYERCLRGGADLAGTFAAAREGRLGALHQAAAQRAATAEAWAVALRDLHGSGCLLPSLPAEPLRHEPTLPSLQQELVDCAKAVFATAVHALRIGFGLWGRWDRA